MYSENYDMWGECYRSAKAKEPEHELIRQQTEKYLASGKTIEQVDTIIHTKEYIYKTRQMRAMDRKREKNAEMQKRKHNRWNGSIKEKKHG